MSRIEGAGLGRLLRRLRTQAGPRARGVAAADTTTSSRAQGNSKTGGAHSGLRVELAARLASIDPRREDADTRAVEAFIECVLTREFGAPLMATPAGQDLLGQVRSALVDSPRARTALLDVLKSLSAPLGRDA
ncbi:hypothetical protein [Noviherbaspirillum pedocola]|uniref:Uncharacterized protein n=1 Tax=Noviherbaspirillum pedocola TaxID=2801341 RepID=A0A934SU99_9BURK|nr:hypothetical protein [Noviherbaspirillum pedocola]MBK4735679.1 hypothetical protein [Noviherbaspirillum pedocola]